VAGIHPNEWLESISFGRQDDEGAMGDGEGNQDVTKNDSG